jgi:hypothetical protein
MSASECNLNQSDEVATAETTRPSSTYGLSKTVSSSTESGIYAEEIGETETRTNDNSIVVKKSAISVEDAIVKRQRIISPAPSNEYPKGDIDDEFAFHRDGHRSPEHRGRIFSHEAPVGPPGRYYHPGLPFRMGRPNPAVQGMHCGPHHPGGHFMSPVAMYSHHGMRPHPPINMPALSGPGMYPPRNMSARGRPGFAAMPPLYARPRVPPTPPSASPERTRLNIATAEKLPQAHLSSPPVTCSLSSTSTSSSATEPLSDGSGNTNRCIPLNPPVPSKYWR